MKPLVAIVGPTATGKSALALALARQFNEEIVNADSRQVYKYMDIGTGKPLLKERAQVPHHLLDIVQPDAEFSLALYQHLATDIIEDVHRRGKLPFLVGGTGLYVWAVLEGLRLPRVPPDVAFRRHLEERAAQEGHESLHNELKQIDPVAAARIDPRNVRRVIRALEVYRATGVLFSRLGAKKAPPYDTLILGLTCSREELYRRIDQRVDAMIERGWVQEVQALLDMGYSPDLPALSSLGYHELVAYLRGELDLPTAVQRIKYRTHAFARRQYAWFRLADPRIRWLDASKGATLQASNYIAEWLKRPSLVSAPFSARPEPVEG